MKWGSVDTITADELRRIAEHRTGELEFEATIIKDGERVKSITIEELLVDGNWHGTAATGPIKASGYIHHRGCKWGTFERDGYSLVINGEHVSRMFSGRPRPYVIHWYKTDPHKRAGFYSTFNGMMRVLSFNR